LREPPWPIRGDLEWGTTAGLLDAVAERLPSGVALVDGGRRLTFADLRDECEEAARALLAAGVSRGDRVAVWLPNRWEWVVAALGAHLVGAVLVPVNTRFRPGEALAVLRRSRAVGLFASRSFLGRDYLAPIVDAVPGGELPALRLLVGLDAGTSDGLLDWESFVASGTGIGRGELLERREHLSPDDVSDILFTSGTTGEPKGVVTTHSQTLRAHRDWCELVGLREGDRYLIVNPFFHCFGYKSGWLACLMMGATIHPEPRLDVENLVQTVAEERISVLPGTPTVFQSLLDHPLAPDLSRTGLRLAVVGGAPSPVRLIERMRSDLGFETVTTGYGMTESTGIATMCRPDDPPEAVSRTVGRPIPDTEVAVLDASGRQVYGEPGEVVIRGYQVMTGYLDDRRATAQVIDADGWLHSGDVGLIDADGRLRITDRLKDVILVGGFNAYPAEVEEVLAQHPQVSHAAVVGAPDGRMGEVPIAYVVPAERSHPAPEELIDWCRARLANYKVPRRIQLVDALPLNATGKVLKEKLREMARTDVAMRGRSSV
jgi:HIP---CoA ligase